MEEQIKSRAAFNVGVATLERLSKQQDAIFISKHSRDLLEIHKNLIILEQEIYPYFKFLKNPKEKMNKLNAVKVKCGEVLGSYAQVKQASGDSSHLAGKSFMLLSEYDALLKDFMQELDLLIPGHFNNDGKEIEWQKK